MNISAACAAIGAAYTSEIEELLAPYWEASVTDEPQDWQMLHRDQWQMHREWCGVDEHVDATLEEVTDALRANPALHLLAWHCHRLVFEEQNYVPLRQWEPLVPLFDSVRPGFGNALFLWLALEAAPRLRARNEPRGIAEQITRDTLEDIAIAVRRFARYNDGAIGIQPRLLYWHRLVASGDLFRVGRFEYIARAFRGRLRAFRNKQSGRVIALSEHETEYNAEGHLPYEGEPVAWRAIYEETSDAFVGNPVSPRGFAVHETVELPRNQWQCVLAPGDMGLEIHIPEGDALTEESCRSSFQEARQFFAQHFPELKVNAFVCYSWLFNTQFETMFPPHSRLVGWQRECYLFPMPSTGLDGLYFVFGQETIDLTTAPRDTQLRRALVEHLEAGNKLRSGGMFFLFEELPQYGTQIYREMEEKF
jgi:hypothetical protein